MRLFEGSFNCCAVFFLIKDKDWLCITNAVSKLGKRHAEIDGRIDEPQQLTCPVDDQIFAVIFQDHQHMITLLHT